MTLRPILLLFLFLAPGLGAAKKLYKFQDELGHWHYTDKPPDTQQKVEIQQLKSSIKQRVFLEKSGAESTPDFFVVNQYPGTIEVEIDWSKKDNAQASPDLPRRFTIAPGKSPPLFTVGSIDSSRGWQFTLQYRYTIGAPLSHYQSETAYYPPLAPGSRFQITQAFGGEFSHNDAQNQYAIDFDMPIDTPVHAARDGVVLEVKNDFYRGGTLQAYADKANSIRILHEDGSMALYAHLAVEKAQVKAGETVKAGQLIGYSGDTGFSSGPHLHFAVQINRGMELASIPFTVKDVTGHSHQPFKGEWLTGFRAH